MKYSLNKWVVMPMGFIYTPAIFMHIINTMFKDVLDSSIAVF